MMQSQWVSLPLFKTNLCAIQECLKGMYLYVLHYVRFLLHLFLRIFLFCCWYLRQGWDLFVYMEDRSGRRRHSLHDSTRKDTGSLYLVSPGLCPLCLFLDDFNLHPFAVINPNHEHTNFSVLSSVNPSSDSLNPSWGPPTTEVKEVFRERMARMQETMQTSGHLVWKGVPGVGTTGIKVLRWECAWNESSKRRGEGWWW